MTSYFRNAFLALILTLPAVAQAEKLTTYQLDNGMDVLVLEDHRAPVVVQMVWYKAGAADEPRGKSGIAHFLEHLLFKGTDTLAPGELSKTVAANGGSDNAFTSQDYTAYHQRIASDRLELVMRMEADRMRNLRLSEADVETEREVILEERNQRTENNPGALFAEQRNAAQYMNHPYGIPVIGWKHEMEELSLEDSLEFYQRYYAPNNAILIVAGDVIPEDVLALAEKYYGVLEPTVDLPERERTIEPPQLSERRLTFTDPRVAQPYVIRSYLAPERDSGAQEEAAALTLLAEILGGNGATSVLGNKLQFDTQQAIYTAAFYSGVSLDDTTFSLIIVPVPDISLEEAEQALDQAVAEFLEEGVDEEQLDRIKMQLRASLIYAEDDVAGRARQYGASLTSGLTIEDVQAWPDVLQSITSEQIIEAAKKVFNRNNAVTGYLMNAEGEAK
ncbi:MULTISPECIES: M16 family metallopeptidase [Halocynthiibacter]|uniref:Insulinase family protein n=1 Tax=Halocynthiibacter halioticoli TaxID=2986804 RepID=A0AAE3J0I6_9RHOB|nr:MULTISPECIES: pitrilysin family protein [Halocynthiibacter]MCV6825742.1 insulinase family protein [Halocynthiibacter halioticoli]MCW4058743.1 insulinase family protein [Halocynthiibacter sp. SDUM655004]